jgi:hypothetical protein
MEIVVHEIATDGLPDMEALTGLVAPDLWPEWDELVAMSDDECRSALAHLAGRDPALFAQVMEVTRPEREDGRARRAARMAR